MNKIELVIIITILVTMTGCVSRASSVQPRVISVSEYTHLSCEDIRTTLDTKRQAEAELTRQQNNAATIDVISWFLTLIDATYFDVEDQLALVKGEVIALRSARDINCFNNNSPTSALGRIKT